MINRDEYVQKLKKQIDDWNAEAVHWEDTARKAQAGTKAEAERQLENFRRRSEEAMAELRRVQGASVDAFADLMRGADRAMQGMKEAFERAQKDFNRK
jgi:hypothetical protein